MAHRVSRALAAVVFRSSVRQGAKGLLTAGIVKSASYSLAKVGQAVTGRRRQSARSASMSKQANLADRGDALGRSSVRGHEQAG